MRFSFIFLCLLGAPIFLCAQSECNHGNSYTELNINNIRAGIPHIGSLWWDGSDGRYIAPKPAEGEPEVSAIFAGGLWLGGEHPDGTTRVAAQTYGGSLWGQTDYFPGPINGETGMVSPDDCTNWDKHFSILRSEVNSHRIDFSNDNEIDNRDSAVYSWPGKDNPHFFDFNFFNLPVGQDLAPFIDTNGDNIYNPDDGDYPDIKGDQAIWWVFNDIGNIHMSSNGLPINIEVQAMAYAYQSFEPAIDNTTFYDFKLKYYGEETLENFQTALWTDVELGCYTDDYFGIDTTRNMAFYYNQDFVDGDFFDQCGSVETYGMEIPVLGIKLLEDSENLGVTSYTYYLTNILGSPPGGITDPSAAREYLRYMSGKWRDNSAIANGGNGYDFSSNDTTTFVFPGNPSIDEEWSLCSAASDNSPELERNTIMSSGGTPLHPGDIRELSYAVIFVPDVPHPCPDMSELYEACEIVENFDGIASDVFDVKNEVKLQIEPNPISSNFRISTQNVNIESVEVISISGERVHYQETLPQQNISIRLNEVVKGFYIVKVRTVNGKYGISKLVVQ